MSIYGPFSQLQAYQLLKFISARTSVSINGNYHFEKEDLKKGCQLRVNDWNLQLEENANIFCENGTENLAWLLTHRDGNCMIPSGKTRKIKRLLDNYCIDTFGY